MNAQQLKNAILQEAIEGRLVPQDPNDEPAFILLEIIRKEKERLVKEGKLKKKDLEEKPISEDEIPFEIPESWEWVRLGEISTYANTKKKINASKADPSIWGLDLEDIEKGGKLLCIKSVGERKAIGDKTCFSEGDILYSKLRPYLLKILIAPKNGICTPEIIPFTCYGNICKDYIVSLLKSAYVDDYINSVTFGVKMPRVSTDTMVSLIIPLPPLAEQKRIMAKIDDLLPKVEKYGKAQDELNKLNEELPERLKKSILQEAIEGRLVPQDPNDEPASVLLDKIREEKKQLVKAGKLKKKDLDESPISEDEIPFEIPESWEWCKLGWIGTWGAGATPAKGNPEFYDNGTIPWLRTGELNNGYVYDSEIKVTEKALEKCSLRMCQKGDVLIAMYGATIGKVAIAGIELTTNQACCACTPYLIYNKYLLYYLLANKKTFTEMGEGGAQPNISREKIIAFPFALPPLAEQKRIVTKIEELMQKIEGLKK
jgi:type I restriction enzyme S subunit